MMAQLITGIIMALRITSQRFATIRVKVIRQRAKVPVAEIAMIDWDHESQFQSVDDFLKFADTFVEQSDKPPRRSRNRR
jgi:hypothetical protein